ncbi:MRN complex-interacting protein isoform X2 [Ornithorhynchus anatinus]|uniref:MRN complex-interacting protein isoform X2 n=1 Tax=Ornithorhynchus anatinus TaxID=9258 RepID=UPI0004547104|nr:MRN complex-interacting protein isoform X2 [Ornithorhynchus anatinus]
MESLQRFQVLRCFSCRLFQVHQVYGQGSGADCRRHVQKLNLMQGLMGQTAEMTLGSSESPSNSNEENTGDPPGEHLKQPELNQSESRWSKYLDQDTEDSPVEDDDDEGPFSYRQQLQQQLLSFKNGTVKTRKRKGPSSCDPSGSAQRDPEGSRYPDLPLGAKKSCSGLTTGVEQESSNSECKGPNAPLTSELSTPVCQTTALPSKWDRFLPTPKDDHCRDLIPSVQERAWKSSLKEHTKASLLTVPSTSPEEENTTACSPGEQSKDFWVKSKGSGVFHLTGGPQGSPTGGSTSFLSATSMCPTSNQMEDKHLKAPSMTTPAMVKPQMIQPSNLFKTDDDFEDDL